MIDAPHRWSGIAPKPLPIKAYSASADKCLRAFLADGGGGRTTAIPFARGRDLPLDSP
jgi:hypothetical protein